MRRWLAILLLLAAPAFAVQPDEVLDDPALEARARELSKGLRCPVCRNESIDESNADLSRDLRLLLRERLVAGDSDDEAVAYMVNRYGEYVLLRPDAKGANLILWLAAPAMLLAALGVGALAVRNRSRATPPAELTEEERARIEELTAK